MSVAEVNSSSGSDTEQDDVIAASEGVDTAALATAQEMFSRLSSVRSAGSGESSTDPDEKKIGAPNPNPGEKPTAPRDPTTRPASDPDSTPAEPPPPRPTKIG